MSNRKREIEEARRALLAGLGAPPPAEFVIDDFQRDAIESVTSGVDTLVVAPTGSGKTFIALEAIKGALFQKARAVYTTPLKALSNTKYLDLKRRFEPEFRVGILTGDRKIEGDADVVVATTEIYRNELYRGSERFSLVILDEVHFIADPQRGPVWEESIILTPRSSALLMLSASISNADEIRAWLEEVRQRPCRVITKIGRPVELRFGFLHPDLGVLPLAEPDGSVFHEVAHYYRAGSQGGAGRRQSGQGPRNQRGPRRGSSGGGGPRSAGAKSKARQRLRDTRNKGGH
jgi:superfamily II RNA helicase